MQPEYLARLSQPVRTFVEEVEAAAGLTIEVVEDAELNAGGPAGQGKLKVAIEAQRVRLYAPTNGYFPDGGVRHEVLHVRRLHVEGVPRLALAEEVDWDPAFEQNLVRVDNALEHLAIVPEELQHHPERTEHWEGVMARTWQVDIPQVPSPLDRRIAACLHWTFLRHVMPGSPTVDVAAAFLEGHGLRAEADSFCGQLVPRLADKVSVLQMFFDWFCDVPKDRAAVEYLSSITGTRLSPIPALD